MANRFTSGGGGGGGDFEEEEDGDDEQTTSDTGGGGGTSGSTQFTSGSGDAIDPTTGTDPTTDDTTTRDTGGGGGTSGTTEFTSGTGEVSAGEPSPGEPEPTGSTSSGSDDEAVRASEMGDGFRLPPSLADSDPDAVRASVADQTGVDRSEVAGVRRVSSLAQQPAPGAVEDFIAEDPLFAPILTEDAFQRRARRSFFEGTDFDQDPSEFLPQDATVEDIPELQIGALRERFGDEAFEFEREQRSSGTVATVGIDEEIQRETARERVAARNEGISPDEVVIEETDEGFRARPEQDALEEALRTRVAGQHGGVEPDEVEITEEDGELRASVETEQTGRPLGSEPQTREQEFLDTVTFGLTRRVRETDDPEVLDPDLDVPSISVDVDNERLLSGDVEAVDVQAQNFPSVPDAPSASLNVDRSEIFNLDTPVAELETENVPDVGRREAGGAAGLAALGVAAPEPVSTGAGLAVLGGLALAGGAATRLNQDRSELEIGEPTVGSELEVSESRRSATEIDVTEGFVSELDVGEPTVSELEPSRPREEVSEISIGDPTDTDDGQGGGGGESVVPDEFPTPGRDFPRDPSLDRPEEVDPADIVDVAPSVSPLLEQTGQQRQRRRDDGALSDLLRDFEEAQQRRRREQARARERELVGAEEAMERREERRRRARDLPLVNPPEQDTLFRPGAPFLDPTVTSELLELQDEAQQQEVTQETDALTRAEARPDLRPDTLTGVATDTLTDTQQDQALDQALVQGTELDTELGLGQGFENQTSTGTGTGTGTGIGLETVTQTGEGFGQGFGFGGGGGGGSLDLPLPQLEDSVLDDPTRRRRDDFDKVLDFGVADLSLDQEAIDTEESILGEGIGDDLGGHFDDDLLP